MKRFVFAVLFFAEFALAQTITPFEYEPPLREGVPVLTHFLAHADQFPSTPALMITLIEELKTKHQLCNTTNAFDRSQCLYFALPKIFRLAFQQNEIDKIEHTSLTHFAHRIRVDRKGNITFARTRSSRTPVDVVAYIQKKRFFHHLRSSKKVEPELSPAAIAALNKRYAMRLPGYGKVPAVDGLLARFNENQIKAMSSLVKDLSENLLARHATLVLDHTRLSELRTELENLQNQAVELGLQNASAEIQTKIWDSISRITSEIEAADTRSRIRKLREEQVAALKSLKADDIEQKNRIEERQLEIEKLETKLTQEFTEVTLGDPELKNYAINELEIKLDELNQSQLFKGRSASLPDVLLSSFIAGDVDDEALTAYLDFKDFQSTHTSALVRTGQVFFNAGRMVLLIHPITAVPTMVSIVIIEAIKSKRAYESENARRTLRVRR